MPKMPQTTAQETNPITTVTTTSTATTTSVVTPTTSVVTPIPNPYPGLPGPCRTSFERTADTLRKMLKKNAYEIQSIHEVSQWTMKNEDYIPQFKGMFRTVDRYMMKYEDVWDQLINHHEDADRGGDFPTKADHNQMSTVRKLYAEINTVNERITMKATANVSAVSSESGAAGNVTVVNQMVTSSVNLPQIELPRFDGTKIIEWPTFRDTFSSVIKEDTKLSATQKFHYLRSALSGHAMSIISEFKVEDQNFELAWASLTLAFDKKRMLAASYLNEILSFSPLQSKPNAQMCQAFLSKIADSVSSFRQLQVPSPADFILFHIAIKCLDPATREQFELAHKQKEFPTIDDLTQFIRERRQALQLTDASTPASTRTDKGNHLSSKSKERKRDPSRSTLALVANSEPKSGAADPKAKPISRSCYVCGANHALVSCVKFYALTPSERLDSLRKWKGCKLCLKSDHKTHDCGAKWDCRFCHHKHNALLHIPTIEELGSDNQARSASPSKDTQSKPALSSTATEVQVVLGTLVARALGADGKFQTVRAVIDSGSHFSFITLKCLNKLGLTAKHCPKRVSGIGQTLFDGIKGQTKCTMRPRNKVSPQLTLEALVVKNITSYLPTTPVPTSITSRYVKFDLADPKFHQPSPIDILIGGDAFPDIWTGSPVSVGTNVPKLFNTVFGFVVMGSYQESQSSDTISPALLATPQIDDDLSFALQRFWELEQPIATRENTLNEEERKCESHFVSTHQRTSSGRFIVHLPFRKEVVDFPDTKGIALKRFDYLERKLGKNSELKEKYHEFMSEYLDLGHMNPTHDPSKFIIPHHAISKIDRGEVKLRVVFDGSSKTSKGSLNNNLMVGQKLQNDIKTIIMNFRIHEIVFVTDIVKCYRQILVNQQDRKFQHIYWRTRTTDPIQKFELNTLTYGLTCSPFLALRCLRQLCCDERHRYPRAAEVLLMDSYIDDIASGASSLQDAKDLQQELIDLLRAGGFELSKWASNCPGLLESLDTPCNDTPSAAIPLHQKDDEKLKILGLQWETASDTFTYVISPPKVKSTKRAIYSTTAKVYDPVGFLAPTIILMKILMQDLWKEQLHWDEIVPLHLAAKWESMLENLPKISMVKIPRFLGSFDKFRVIGFADASEKAYCAALYLQVISGTDIKGKLITAKTKVAPVKPLTIPRLELCAALLLSRLYESSSSVLARLEGVELSPRFFTDSTTVLGWINTPTYKLQTFVCHRITEINRIIPEEYWRHVISKENPADCGSRGLPPDQLATFSLWWAGPPWLTLCESNWPSSSPAIPEELPEMKAAKGNSLFVSASDPHFIEWIKRFSSYWKLVRTIARVKRFVKNHRQRKVGSPTKNGDFTSEEIGEALRVCIKQTQLEYLLNGSEKNADFVLKKFSKLHPFIDKFGIIRVGGRLRHSSVDENQKHPVLLPPNVHFTTILVDHLHRQYLHPGPNALQALIQLRYWIPSLRRVVRQRTFFCAKCYKLKAKKLVPIMGDLPPCRVLGGRAFVFVGVDFAGPFIIRDSLRRKAQQSKCYLCLFVCMASKALHLEVVSSLSTEAFLAALARFVARRGLPAEIFSDCGSNFLGAARSIRECLRWFSETATKDAIAQYTASVGITWNFNPPHAPHFGGLWEAGVKSAKTHLKKIAGDSVLTFEELTTVFAKIEAILNSRPLCPLSNSPEEIDYLSPGHFLIGRPLLAVPQPTLEDRRDNLLTRWQILKKMEDTFWRRWRNEYLSTLQTRIKWDRPSGNLDVGDLVLMKGDTCVLQWPTARITKIHPGPDGVVRVATVQTAASTYQRPVVELVPLLPLKIEPYDQK